MIQYHDILLLNINHQFVLYNEHIVVTSNNINIKNEFIVLADDTEYKILAKITSSVYTNKDNDKVACGSAL